MNLLQHGFGSIEAAVASYGVFALFVVLYFESLGMPLPGESALIAISLLAARGDFAIAMSFWRRGSGRCWGTAPVT